MGTRFEPIETSTTRGETAVKELDLVGLRARVAECERPIASLAYLAVDVHWSLSGERASADRPDARDAVVLILFGTIRWLTTCGPLARQKQASDDGQRIDWYEKVDGDSTTNCTPRMTCAARRAVPSTTRPPTCRAV